MPKCLIKKQNRIKGEKYKLDNGEIKKWNGKSFKKICLCIKESSPKFGYVGESPICCSYCKKEGMIDLCHKKCRCGKKYPTYSYEGNLPLCCIDCKEINMIDVSIILTNAVFLIACFLSIPSTYHRT